MERGNDRELGSDFIDVKEESKIFEGIWEKGKRNKVWMRNGESVK